MTDAIRLADTFARFDDHWNPRIVASLNGQHVKAARIQGDFIWHRHDNEDELFFVVKGRMRMDFRDREVWVGENEMIVVPRGVEHKPYAPDEVWLLLFEPAGTLNTGNVADSDRTVPNPEAL
jgi:mannose-6-phosphate isomerase-like protein (cupin superfamily)